MSENIDNLQTEPIEYFRPETRGKLVQCLKSNIPCEVVADNEDITRMLIDNYLAPPPYTTHPSENVGWVVFERK